MTVKFPIGKTIYKAKCDEAEEDALLGCVTALNQRIEDLSEQFSPKTHSEQDLLAIAALMMEKEIEELRSGSVKKVAKDDEEISLTEDDLNDAVAENIENMADYVENLIKKIEKL